MSQLAIIALPIGNEKDITLRALETLRAADLILAEDTRTFSILSAHLDLTKLPLRSYHDHNELDRIPETIDLIKRGKKVCLVSDAGTPGINDPGYRIVKAVLDEGLVVTSCPGPSAVITAASLSPFGGNDFYFGGFLPAKSSERKTKLKEIKSKNCRVFLYEAPHRVIETFEDSLEVLGDVPAAFFRELTKPYEEIRYGTVSSLLLHLSAHAPRGEFVLLLHPQEKLLSTDELLHYLKKLDLSQSTKDLVKELQQLPTSLSRQELYDLILTHKK